MPAEITAQLSGNLGLNALGKFALKNAGRRNESCGGLLFPPEHG